MNNEFEREIALIGLDNYNKLKNSHIAIFGLGGVGSYTLEMLARSGVSEFSIIDFDTFSLSNINRQVGALHSTINKLKTDVMASRIKDINPDIKVHIYNIFIDDNTINNIDFSNINYICDCIDNINGKLAIIKKAYDLNIKIISCAGTGNKLNPLEFKIKKINQTSVCPLAKKMRQKLKELNINDCLFLYSEEVPFKSNIIENNKVVPMSISFVPSVAGILLARHIILDIINLKES